MAQQAISADIIPNFQLLEYFTQNQKEQKH
jgi:hypothetical protein